MPEHLVDVTAPQRSRKDSTCRQGCDANGIAHIIRQRVSDGFAGCDGSLPADRLLIERPIIVSAGPRTMAAGLQPAEFEDVVRTLVALIVAEHLTGQFQGFITSTGELRQLIANRLSQPAHSDRREKKKFWRSAEGIALTNKKLIERQQNRPVSAPAK